MAFHQHTCAFAADCAGYGWQFCTHGCRRPCAGCEKCAPVREQLSAMLQGLVQRMVLTPYQARTALDDLERSTRELLAEAIRHNRT